MRADEIQQLRERVWALTTPIARSRARPGDSATTWCDAFGVTIAAGAVHEILAPAKVATPRQFALLLARATFDAGNPDDARVVAWIEDPADPWYAPAVARALRVSSERILVLHPPPTREAKAALWALAECLGSAGVCATIARVPDKLSQLDARRLQLAAERGGGVGVLLRTHGPTSRTLHYAAATRWLVEPLPGTARSQRWRITLLHGQGGRIGHPVALEVDRETDRVRALEELAGQSLQATPDAPGIATG